MKTTLSFLARKLRVVGLAVAFASFSAELAAETAANPFHLPIPMVWQVNAKTLTRRQYVKDIDYLKAKTHADILHIAPVQDVIPEDAAQFAAAAKELVDNAHRKGLRVNLRASPLTPGFFAAPPFPGKNGLTVREPLPCIIPDQREAQALTADIEGILDDEGYALLSSEAKGNREKVIPLYAKPLRAFAFEKTRDGFYRPDTLVDVTKSLRIVAQDNRSIRVELDLGKSLAGRNVFFLAAHFFNAYELYEAAPRAFCRLFDSLAEVGLNGATSDECGFMSVDAWGKEPFRARFYSFAADRYWRETLKTDFCRLLFDMRYAPEGNESVRIRAINRYFDEFRRVPLAFERFVADYQLEHHADLFLACHATYHNSLESDDMVHNACDYWSVPRDYGFTDEATLWPIRLGVLLGSKLKFGYNMYYSKDPAAVYRNIIECAPWKIREFHHAYNDGWWGLGYTEEPFTTNVRRLDEAVRELDAFQKGRLPRTDVLVVFGEFAHANWYPDETVRGHWDHNGSLGIMEKSEGLWKAGHVAALVPDRLIEDSRLRFEDGVFKLYPITGRTVYNTDETRQPAVFGKLLFLYPRYAKTSVWNFLNEAAAKEADLLVFGPADRDFDGKPAAFQGRRLETWSVEGVTAALQLAKSRIPGGCVYDDGSFALVSDAILTGKPTAYDFELDGVRHKGEHRGVYTWASSASRQ